MSPEAIGVWCQALSHCASPVIFYVTYFLGSFLFVLLWTHLCLSSPLLYYLTTQTKGTQYFRCTLSYSGTVWG